MKRAAGRPAIPAARSAAASSRSTRTAAPSRGSRYTIPDHPELLRVYADGTELRGPAGGAIWSAPTIDAQRGALYVGVGNTYSGAAQPTTDAILAFDLKSGALRWSQQMAPSTPDVFGCTPGDVNCGERPGPDFDFGASPVLATLASGRQLIVAGQKSGVVYALDPDRRGQRVWRYRAGGGSGLGGIQWGIAVGRRACLCAGFRHHNPEPGGLHAVDLATGERAWYAKPEPPVCGKPGRACSGAQFSAGHRHPGCGLLAVERRRAARLCGEGRRRPLAARIPNGTFRTVNGVRAHGGSMYGPAPIVAGGMLYIGSGLRRIRPEAGNVLLAFGVE